MAVRRSISIKEIRLKNGLSQDLLARNLKRPVEVIKSWENGDLTPSRKDLLSIHNLFGFSLI
ncbi:MAG: helix-turn-helix domain-containing protein [Spirochaetaceae bacterium]